MVTGKCVVQDMDRDVLRVGRELALCTLDVQLDALYLCLEEEVRQILDVEAGSEITGQEPAAELAQVRLHLILARTVACLPSLFLTELQARQQPANKNPCAYCRISTTSLGGFFPARTLHASSRWHLSSRLTGCIMLFLKRDYQELCPFQLNAHALELLVCDVLCGNACSKHMH